MELKEYILKKKKNYSILLTSSHYLHLLHIQPIKQSSS